mmetsp:Transcript_6086/g.7950  ORF Transcript_6086/g.7950 Transcript_6086/m.7950 type:complete len:246 (-) Transcript_6086:94-831(-)
MFISQRNERFIPFRHSHFYLRQGNLCSFHHDCSNWCIIIEALEGKVRFYKSQYMMPEHLCQPFPAPRLFHGDHFNGRSHGWIVASIPICHVTPRHFLFSIKQCKPRCYITTFTAAIITIIAVFIVTIILIMIIRPLSRYCYNSIPPIIHHFNLLMRDQRTKPMTRILCNTFHHFKPCLSMACEITKVSNVRIIQWSTLIRLLHFSLHQNPPRPLAGHFQDIIPIGIFGRILNVQLNPESHAMLLK